MKKSLLALMLIAALSGCSGFKLGAMHYCPYEQNCETSVRVPVPAVPAASAVK